jgi:hypothetical protein
MNILKNFGSNKTNKSSKDTIFLKCIGLEIYRWECSNPKIRSYYRHFWAGGRPKLVQNWCKHHFSWFFPSHLEKVRVRTEPLPGISSKIPNKILGDTYIYGFELKSLKLNLSVQQVQKCETYIRTHGQAQIDFIIFPFCTRVFKYFYLPHMGHLVSLPEI